MNILLHICCAPCAICAVGEIRRAGHSLSGFFYNPNIHPYTEHQHRKDVVDAYAREAGLGVSYGGYEIEKFFQNITYDEAGLANRCPPCWWMRLEATVKFALANGFDTFTTTLLGSPYQDHAIIKKICEEISVSAGIGFYYNDFRTGFRDAHANAKADGIYCQNYCGCLFSERERMERRKAQSEKCKV